MSFSFGTPKPAAPAPFVWGTPASSSAAQSTSQPVAAPSLFSFGASQPAPAAAAPTFSFGASNNQQSNPFSLAPKPVAQGSVLGGSLFASPANITTPTQPSLSQSILGGPQAEQSIQDRLRSIQLAWDPSSPQCQFMYYVYNVMDQQRAQWVQQNGHQRTQQDVNEALWLKAIRENPDPARLSPHLVVGFENLAKRAGQQQEFAQKHQGKLDDFTGQLKHLSSQYSLQTSLRIQKAAHAQSVLSARLMSIVARVHALTPQRSAPLRPDEEALKTQIDALASDFTGKRPAEAAYLLEDPNSGVSSGRLQTKVNELWVAMAQKRSKQMLSASKEEWTITDEQEMQKVLEVLAQQQRTLDYLSQTLTFDIQALDIVKSGFNEASFLETERKMQQSGTPTRK